MKTTSRKISFFLTFIVLLFISELIGTSLFREFIDFFPSLSAQVVIILIVSYLLQKLMNRYLKARIPSAITLLLSVCAATAYFVLPALIESEYKIVSGELLVGVITFVYFLAYRQLYLVNSSTRELTEQKGEDSHGWKSRKIVVIFLLFIIVIYAWLSR